jgi:hypothetical protein
MRVDESEDSEDEEFVQNVEKCYSLDENIDPELGGKNARASSAGGCTTASTNSW